MTLAGVTQLLGLTAVEVMVAIGAALVRKGSGSRCPPGSMIRICPWITFANEKASVGCKSHGGRVLEATRHESLIEIGQERRGEPGQQDQGEQKEENRGIIWAWNLNNEQELCQPMPLSRYCRNMKISERSSITPSAKSGSSQ